MKIGILTFWESSNNYGQILQLFALQKYLQRIGHEPFLIRFKRIPPKRSNSLIERLVSVDFAKAIQYRLNRKTREKSILLDKKRDFLRFKEENIVFGDITYSSFEDLKTNPPYADVYIVGSDQVWNNSFRVSAEPFLLGFGSLETKRIAYAASFGHTMLDEKSRILFEKYLPNFDGISVREESGLEICRSAGIEDAKWVVDPTLLFNSKEWSELLKIQDIPNKKINNRIFIYTLGNSKISDKDKFLDYVKKLRKFDIVHATANSDFSGNVYPTISEWVNYIRTSNFVITTSFHGMVFCIINRTNFVVLPNTGHASGMNERIESLLKVIGLKHHIMNKFSESVFKQLLEEEIEWGTIDKKISEWKMESSYILEEFLKLDTKSPNK